MSIKNSFWQGKRVLITGHTGFKGSWLAIWLIRLGAKVTGIALPPNTSPNLFELANVAQDLQNYVCDIRDAASLKKILFIEQPEIIFHLAAQPLVRASYREPLDTFSTNIMGSANLLDSLRGLENLQVVVMVTTDKVYFNREHHFPFREDDTLGGHDPYSASKAASEIVISSYRDVYLKEQGVAVASARAGNVIGGGDWSDDRLIPDAVRSWSTGQTLVIRNPHSTRPWQHVLEPLSAYITLAQKLWQQPELAGAYNFGPHTHQAGSVETVINLARAAYGEGLIAHDMTKNNPHESNWLALEVAKARLLLGVNPKWLIDESVSRTMEWYKAQRQGANARFLCETEIGDYEVLE